MLGIVCNGSICVCFVLTCIATNIKISTSLFDVNFYFVYYYYIHDIHNLYFVNLILCLSAHCSLGFTSWVDRSTFLLCEDLIMARSYNVYVLLLTSYHKFTFALTCLVLLCSMWRLSTRFVIALFH